MYYIDINNKTPTENHDINLYTVNDTTVARSDVAILRQVAASEDQLNLSVPEQNSLKVFKGKADQLDAVQKKIDAIYARPSIKGYEKDLSGLETQAKRLTKEMWQISQYDLLKSVSDKTREHLVQQYGAIEEGEKASREAQGQQGFQDRAHCHRGCCNH